MGCGCDNEQKFDGVSDGYRRALWAVIAINGLMFFVEMFGGLAAKSQALQADALDFLGDTATYALSLWVVGKSVATRTSAALFKGFTLSFFGIGILVATVYRVFVLETPQAATMGVIGFVALIANCASVLILLRYRDGDSNVRSVWLCSRNDAIGNLAVIVAAFLVVVVNHPWPDLAVAALMASLFLHSSWLITRQALAERREAVLAQAG